MGKVREGIEGKEKKLRIGREGKGREGEEYGTEMKGKKGRERKG